MKCMGRDVELNTHMEMFLTDFKTKKLKSGEMLSHPQDSDNRVFYIIKGRLKVFLSYGDKIFTLAFLSPGDIYCTHTRAFVEALDVSEIKACDLQLFSKSLDQHPQLMGTMTRVLSTTLSGCIDTIENLAFRDVKARFSGFLMGQIPPPLRQDEDVIVTLPLTIEQLSQVIGTSRQTLSSLISELEKELVIKRAGRGRFLVYQPLRLERIANQ
ncbi:Crp/Fnr family transcriptional regulator [Vibrio sp. RC27]